MKHTHSESKHEQIQWRRNKVLELTSKEGREIGSGLQIAPPIAYRNIAYLNQHAKQNLSMYIDELLPAEYRKCLIGITAVLHVLHESWNTAASAEAEGDRRDKMQALSLAKERYAMKLDLLSSATIG